MGRQLTAEETHWWVIREEVEQAMGSLPLTADDRDWLDLCVRAGNAMIRRFRCDLPVPNRAGGPAGPFAQPLSPAFQVGLGQPNSVDPMVTFGAVQLVTEMYRRRGLTSGENLPQYSEFGPPPSSLSYEAQLFLGLGRHHAPVIA
jgi:hypothetical protein